MECGIRDAACIDTVDAFQNSIEIYKTASVRMIVTRILNGVKQSPSQKGFLKFPFSGDCHTPL